MVGWYSAESMGQLITHCVHSHEKKRGEFGSQRALFKNLFIQYGTPAQGMVLPTCRVILSPKFNLSKASLQTLRVYILVISK